MLYVLERRHKRHSLLKAKKKKKVLEDGECDNAISCSFVNISMAMDRATKVMEKGFMKISGVEIYAILGYWTLSQLW